MSKKNNLVSETVMYSINPGSGQIVTHHLPWPRTSPQLQKYVERGLTFERPQSRQVEAEPVVVGEKVENNICPVCNRAFKSSFGLSVHMRSHKKEG